MDSTLRGAIAALHFWEEPPISGTRGSGAVCVANPSDLCDFLAKKSVNLMKMIMIPVLGVVENKAFLTTDKGDVLLGTEPQEHAEALNLNLLATVPLSLELSVMADFGRISEAQVPELQPVAQLLAK
jgi:Mrp family chromosome partitioning ATPase